VLARVDDIKLGSLLAAFAIMFFPVTLFGMYSPFAIRLLLHSPLRSGRVSGTVYAVSTAGSIFGTLGTTFFLIPAIGSRAITLTLGAAGIVSGIVLLLYGWFGRRRAAAGAILLAVLVAAASTSRADSVIDDAKRAAMLKRADGRIAHLETEYNDVFINKRGTQLTMSFQLKGWDYTESVVNLADPDDMPLRYTQVMTVALAYPETPKSILMLGLGGGSIPIYLGRFLPESSITTVEIDPGVISAAKTYFGIRETPRMRYRDADARVFLNRNPERHDLILVDAYRGGYVPVHLLTREFYALLKQRLAPGGAVAFNIHDGSKLYASTVRTLGEVFSGLDLYPTGLGEVIAIATATAPDKEALAARAERLQERYGFRYRLPEMMKRRLDKPPLEAAKADLITDDFAPADIYDATSDRPRKRK
jgi:spermidine synthase